MKGVIRSRLACVFLLLLIAAAVSGCGYGENGTVKKQKGWEQRKEGEEAEGEEAQLEENDDAADNLDSQPIDDNFALYTGWDYEEVQTMYLTVRSGNEADGTNHTWEEVNSYSAYYYEREGIDRYKVEGLLQLGDETGPLPDELGYGQYTPNAVVQIRGQTSTRSAQKNYRVSLKDGKGDWEGQTVINLNKHVGDGTRFMNMLCYKLMKDIDGMMSARTKFVHLYVKDETSGAEGFADYGLYTYVEQINRGYLREHGLDRSGQLYKVNFFEFLRFEDVIRLRTDAEYNVTEFEKYLEIKGDDDHSKLIGMLEELNDYGNPIEEVFPKWFDEENYFSWLAFHILMGNKDTEARNHFLYSPRNIDKFYFISWDNDAALRALSIAYLSWRDGMAHEEGISNYWGNVLHRRVLQSASYRKKLDDKINELRQFLSEDRLREESESLAAIVKPYLYRMPDVEYAMLTEPQFDEVVEAIPAGVEANYERYLESLKKPMPFFLGDPVMDGGKLTFHWDPAYDFDQETIYYKFELGRDYLFENPIYVEEGLVGTDMELDMPAAGQYFYRVTAKNTSGYEQMAFDYYNSTRGKEYGMKSFWITQDGQIQVEEYEE